MFQLSEDDAALAAEVARIERNYVIQKDDLLTLDVFTNDGEQIIDPNFELLQGNLQNQNLFQFNYLVQQDGYLKVPVLGKVKVDSLTIDEAETILEERFEEYYKGAFVRLQFANKRVTVLGSVGNMMVPLVNENMTLPEVLAISGGVTFGSKAQNIRIIRGDLTDPQVFVINLNTVEGMMNSIIPIEPNDIIYVEPWRRPFLEAFQDIAPFLSVTTSLVAIVVLIQSL
ncbi:MAG: polysaccharide biosynthesis/export family protein [Bacteroidota bacterium]